MFTTRGLKIAAGLAAMAAGMTVGWHGAFFASSELQAILGVVLFTAGMLVVAGQKEQDDREDLAANARAIFKAQAEDAAFFAKERARLAYVDVSTLEEMKD